MSRVDLRDIIGGLLLMAIGLFFLMGALDMRIGEARRMGPGYFPMVLGIAGMILGALIVIPAFMRSGRLPGVNWRPFFAVMTAILVFALVMPRAGLLPAVFATVVVASFGDPRSRLWQTVLLAAGLAVATWVIFIYGLGLPMIVYRMPF
ncbi:MAG TPA: tripartite tricarboxylate transporter TctB family protein [Saliniramus sp.]|nr:tripartite tricarboxylate transporter TctB family protein [Saliniramus sp.]